MKNIQEKVQQKQSNSLADRAAQVTKASEAKEKSAPVHDAPNVER